MRGARQEATAERQDLRDKELEIMAREKARPATTRRTKYLIGKEHSILAIQGENHSTNMAHRIHSGEEGGKRKAEAPRNSAVRTKVLPGKKENQMSGASSATPQGRGSRPGAGSFLCRGQSGARLSAC